MNSPYYYQRNYYWPSSFYSGFGFNYGYSGFGYGYYGYGYGYNSGYYGGLNGYGYYPYHSTFPTYEFKRKGEHNLRSLSRDNSNTLNQTSQSTRTRLLDDQQLSKNTASGENREMIRTRTNAERTDGERLRSTSNLRGDGRDERYIRRADSRDNERGTSTYNRVERTNSDKFNQRNKENTLSRYIEASDRERSSVVNHRYNTRPNNETTRSSNVRNIIRSSDNNSSTVRRRSTYSRPNNNSSSNNSSGSTIRRNSGSSNNNNSGSTIRRSSSSSNNSSSTRSRSSSSSSSGGRKRK